MRKCTYLVPLVAVTVLLSSASSASAKQHHYVGHHPSGDDSFCYIEAPHVHAYAPVKAKVLYRVHDKHHHFVGDPVAHGYDGPRHAYYGHHPISVSAVLGANAAYPHHGEFCYLDGAHYHAHAPVAVASFELKGEAYWYVGKFPPAYKRHRPRAARINAVYGRVDYVRPVITVAPPVAYAGVVFEADLHVAPIAAVSARAEIGVPIFGVEVHDHHDHYRYKHKKHKKYKYKKYKHKRHKYKVKRRPYRVVHTDKRSYKRKRVRKHKRRKGKRWKF